MAVWNTAASLPLIVRSGPSSYISDPNGLPLEQVTASGPVYFYHLDQIGNTHALTDSTGAVQGTYAYDPYGNVTTSSGSVTNPLQFQGQNLDSMSSLYYMRARWYDPSSGQFMSVDPIVAVTRSPYAFTAGNPINVRDATGLDKSWWDRVKDIGLITLTCLTGAIDCLLDAVTRALEPTDAGERNPDPHIYEKNASHIFRDAPGHLSCDSPENRQLLISTVTPDNYLGEDKWGNQWYARTQDDGSEVWVETRNGTEIRDGGVNPTPGKWDPQTGLSRT